MRISDETAVSYKYNPEGIRIGKTVNDTETSYFVDASGTMQAMKQGDEELVFMYDATGRREGFIWYHEGQKQGTYYYLYNMQSDVIGMVAEDMSPVVTYEYDAWGKLLSISGEKKDTVGKLNPFRYRGYVYEEESGLYYVSSRYYDPEVNRFISPDTIDVLEVQDDLYDKNLYAYCDNNPVMRVDSSGAVWHLAVGAVIGVATQFVADVGLGLASGSSLKEIMSSLSPVDYVSAAIGGAMAASGITLAGSVVANAALGGTTYLANCSYKGVKANAGDFVASTVIGGAAGRVGGAGANGKQMRGVYGRSKQVINATKSARKKAMYTAKITAIKKKVVKSTGQTGLAGFVSNVGNWVRKLFSRSKA